MRDRGPTGQFACGAFRIDVDPLRRGSIGELVDAILGNFDLVADADFGADSALEVVKIVEHAHSLLLWSDSQKRANALNRHLWHCSWDDGFGLGIGDHVRDAQPGSRFHHGRAGQTGAVIAKRFEG